MAGSLLFSEVVEDLLRSVTGVAPAGLDPDQYFGNEALRSVHWLPRYLYRTGDRVWAIEVVRDDYLAEESLRSIVEAASLVDELSVAIFIPQGEPLETVVQRCRADGLPVIASTGAAYEFLPAPGVPAGLAAPPSPSRIPPNLADRVGTLEKLRPDFVEALKDFASQHQKLRARAVPRQQRDEEEQKLLKRTLSRLMASDERFVGGPDALDMLRVVERWSQAAGTRVQDHYFHSFHTFLLGCIVLDGLHDCLTDYLCDVFPGTEALSLEYIWLLAALYHDVGYVVRLGPEIEAARFGDDLYVDPNTGARSTSLADHEIAQRNCHWRSQPYRLQRIQLVSLYQHLNQEKILGSWTADPLGDAPPDHPFDRAMHDNFLSPDGHGAASCLRMLMEVAKRVKRDLPFDVRQFLVKHIYVAGLSIPFHDWRFRETLKSENILQLSTRRLPLAALLMFIDSIQDDRRDPASLPFEERDVLEDMQIHGDTVVANVNIARIQADRFAEKKVEAKGVRHFLQEDGIKFRYPDEFLQD